MLLKLNCLNEFHNFHLDKLCIQYNYYYFKTKMVFKLYFINITLMTYLVYLV